MESWLHDNGLDIFSTHNEGKSERFIRTLKKKTYKHMATVSKNVYTDRLDEIVGKYKKTHKIIKMKPANVQPSTYTEYGVENNENILSSKLLIA